MSDAICYAAKNCYALTWSYGEICVNSNCCGRRGKGFAMWQARLKYHTECLEENENFDRWIPGLEEIQRKNVAENIKYERAKIKACRRMITKIEKQ